MANNIPSLTRRYDHLIDLYKAPNQVEMTEGEIAIYEGLKNENSQHVDTGVIPLDNLLLVATKQRDEKILSIVLERLPLSIEGYWTALKEVTYKKDKITAQDERIGKLLIGSLIERSKVYGLPKYALWPTIYLTLQISKVALNTLSEIAACINKDEDEVGNFDKKIQSEHIAIRNDGFIMSSILGAVSTNQGDLINKIQEIFKEIRVTTFRINLAHMQMAGILHEIGNAVKERNLNALDECLENIDPTEPLGFDYTLYKQVVLLIYDITAAYKQEKRDEISEMVLDLLLRKIPHRREILQNVLLYASKWKNLILIKQMVRDFLTDIHLRVIDTSPYVKNLWSKSADKFDLDLQNFIFEERGAPSEVPPPEKDSPQYKSYINSQITEYIDKLQITQKFLENCSGLSFQDTAFGIIQESTNQLIEHITYNSPNIAIAQEKLFSLMRFFGDKFKYHKVLKSFPMTNTVLYKHLLQNFSVHGGIQIAATQKELIQWVIEIYPTADSKDGCISLMESLILDMPIASESLLIETVHRLIQMHEQETLDRQPLITNLLQLLIQENPMFSRELLSSSANSVDKELLYTRFMKALYPRLLFSLRQKEYGQSTRRHFPDHKSKVHGLTEAPMGNQVTNHYSASDDFS